MSQSIAVPPRLREGDTVAVVAPSGPLDRERLKRSLPLLERRYRVRVAEDIFARDGFLAGSDQRRADELNAAFADTDARAVFIARGGYGLTRILPLLDPAPLIADPVPIIGFSDATALLGWALVRANLASIHGPVVRQLSELCAADIQWLFDLLENPKPGEPVLSELDGAASASGTLWGGNLSLVAHSVATPYWPSAPADAILFLEEVGERPYAIDRSLTRLFAAGALDGVTHAIVGSLVRCSESRASDHPSAAVVFRERLEAFGIHPLFTEEFGHGTHNRALPFAGQVAIDGGVMRLRRGAVS